MSQDLKESSPEKVAYPSISLAEFMADLMGWKPPSKNIPTKNRVKATRRKTRASSEPTHADKA